MFISSGLGIILFNNDTILELLGLHLVQVLSLDDVLKTAFISISLQLVEQVELVALELLDTLVESGDRIEHLVMLVLELKSLLLCLLKLRLEHQDLLSKLTIALLLLIQVLLDVRSSSDGSH